MRRALRLALALALVRLDIVQIDFWSEWRMLLRLLCPEGGGGKVDEVKEKEGVW